MTDQDDFPAHTPPRGGAVFGEPPRATQVLDPAELPRLYPCDRPQPHDPHLCEPAVGDLIVRYRCDGHGGIVLGTATEPRA